MTFTFAGMSSDQVQAELLSPAELDSALLKFPLAYLPLGSLEYHGPHLPIGLDTLTAHGVCVEAARVTGGVVLPPLYQGIGGEYSSYPWTIMMDSEVGIRSHLIQTLTRLESFGVRGAVLFSGHFAGEQAAMIDTIAADWNAGAGRSLHVVASAVNRCPTSPVSPDHAGIFETSLLHALRPDLVHLDRLPSTTARPAIDPGGDVMGPQRRDPSHPLWGIFGPDPRELDLSSSRLLLDTLVAWLVSVATGRSASD
jgi:creatinine amidohydrolase